MVKVSVIIPTYGMPVFLEKSIDSVINQSMKDLELIIVDDNNPNTEERNVTEKIVNNYLKKDTRISYIKHEFNKNGSAARNTGIKVAKGKYISFLDSDDEYGKDRLELCVNCIENCDDPKFAGVYTGCEFRKEGKTYLQYKNVKGGNFLIETLASTFMFCTGSNIFMKADVIRKLGGFDDSFFRHQDYEFLVRYFEKFSLLAIPEMLVIKNNENFNLPNPEKIEAVKKQYLGKYKDIIEMQSSENQKFIYSSQLISLAEMYIKSGNQKKSKVLYNKASKIKKVELKYKIRRVLLSIKYRQ